VQVVLKSILFKVRSPVISVLLAHTLRIPQAVPSLREAMLGLMLPLGLLSVLRMPVATQQFPALMRRQILVELQLGNLRMDVLASIIEAAFIALA
jgi:hypothetical protein